jgi:hypothetical protein
MIASEWNALQSPNNKVLGYNGVLNRDDEIGLPSPSAIGDMAAWYDATDFGSMVMDASANVSLLSDVSGQSGAVSGDSYLELDGTSGAYASSPDSAALDIIGDLEFRYDYTPTAISPASAEIIAMKRSAAGIATSAYGVYIGATGIPSFLYSGGGIVLIIGTATFASVGLTSLQRFQVKTVFDADNGAGGCDTSFYYRTDGDIEATTGWTQVGATVTTAGVAVINSTADPIQIGAQFTGGTSLPANGNLHRVMLYNTAGTLVFDADFTNRGASNQSFPESSSNAALVTINGSARITHLDTENCLVLPGVTGNYASVPDAAALTPAGDFSGWMDIESPDYTPAALQRLLVHGGGASTRALFFSMNTSGTSGVSTDLDGMMEPRLA